MIVQYFDVIHCKTQEQVTAVINKLHSEQGLTWMHDDENPLIKNPADFEIEQKFFKNINEEEKEEFYIVTVKFPELDKCIVYISRKEHNTETMRAALAETDEEESSAETVFYEAEEFLGSFIGSDLFGVFSIDYEVYNTEDNHICSIKNKKELSEIYNKAIEEGTTFVVFPSVFCAINSIPTERPFPISTLFSHPVEDPKKLTPSLYSSTLRISL